MNFLWIFLNDLNHLYRSCFCCSFRCGCGGFGISRGVLDEKVSRISVCNEQYNLVTLRFFTLAISSRDPCRHL